jgi:hypothetical protein
MSNKSDFNEKFFFKILQPVVGFNLVNFRDHFHSENFINKDLYSVISEFSCQSIYNCCILKTPKIHKIIFPYSTATLKLKIS